jgi:hypothetical protein
MAPGFTGLTKTSYSDRKDLNRSHSKDQNSKKKAFAKDGKRTPNLGQGDFETST